MLFPRLFLFTDDTDYKNTFRRITLFRSFLRTVVQQIINKTPFN